MLTDITAHFTNPFTLLFFGTFLINILFVFILMIRHRRPNRTEAAFLLMMFINSVWAFTQGMLSIATTPDSYGFWYSMMELAVTIIMPTELLFVLTFVEKERLLDSFGMLSFIFFGCITQIFLYWKTNIVTIHDFRAIIHTPWGYQYPRGSFPFDLLIIVTYIAIIIYQLVAYFTREKNATRRHQIILIILSVCIPTIGGLLYQGIIPVIRHVPEFPITPPLTLVTCFIMGYVLIRYGERTFSLVTFSSELIQIIPGSIVILDAANRIQSTNPSFLELVGKKEDELLGRSFFDLAADNAAKQRWQSQVFNQLACGKGVNDAQVTIAGATVPIPVTVRASVRCDGSGQPVNTFLVLTDISPIKKTEQQVVDTVQHMQEQNNLLEDNKIAMLNLLEDSRELEKTLKDERDRATTIVSSMSEGLFVIDKNYRLTILNPEAAQLFGFSEKAVLGRNLSEITKMYKKGIDVPVDERPLMRTLKTGESVVVGLEDDYSLLGVGGNQFPVALATAPLKRDQEIVGALVTFRDISRDKRVKETIEKTVEERTHDLVKEQARLTASIRSLSLGFIMINRSGKVVLSNEVVQKVLGCKEMPKSFDDLVAILGKYVDLPHMRIQCEQQQQPVHADSISFGTKWIRLFMAPVVTQEQAASMIGVVFLIEDITEAKVLERSREEFFSIASHELRTPLTAIRGNTSMIKEYYGEKLEKDVQEMVNDIHESSIRLIDIVNDFLDMSRLEQGRMQFKPEAFAIDELIKSVLKEYDVTGSRQKLYLKYEPPDKPIPKVFADSARVKQILINLVGNAIKFTNEGGVTVKILPDGRMLRVLVEDTGRGIPYENQMLLFRKFQQAGDSLFTRDTTKGTGLGLYISKLMVEGMGGAIGLQYSQPDKGTAFGFSLPVVQDGATAPPANS